MRTPDIILTDVTAQVVERLSELKQTFDGTPKLSAVKRKAYSKLSRALLVEYMTTVITKFEQKCSWKAGRSCVSPCK